MSSTFAERLKTLWAWMFPRSTEGRSIQPDGDSLYHSTYQRVIELEALRQATLSLTSSLDLDEVLRTIVQASLDLDAAIEHTRIFHYDNGILGRDIALANNDTQPRTWPNPRPDGMTYNVARTGETWLVPNIQIDPFFTSSQPNWHGALIGMPLKYAGQVVGVMNIHYLTPQEFTDEKLQLFHLLADQAAIAIENARLYEAERRQRSLAEALVIASRNLNSNLDLNSILSEIMDLLLNNISCDTVNIMLVENGNATIRHWRGRIYEEVIDPNNADTHLPLNTPNLANMIIKGSPLTIADTRESPDWRPSLASPWVRSYAGAPLIANDEILGFLNLDSSIPGNFKQQDLEWLEVFASHASSAIQNARLFESEKQAHQRAAALLDTVKSFSSTLSIEDVLNTFLSQSTKLLAYSSSSIMAFTGVHPRLIATSGDKLRGIPSDQLNDTFNESKILNKLRDEKQPILITDTSNHPDWIPFPNLEYIRSWIGIPLMWQDELLGVWNLDHEEVQGFNFEHLEMAAALGAEVAIAIQNANLYEQTFRHAEELEERVAQRTHALRQSNQELESFAYSISHDLRAPLRAMEGFSKALVQDYGSQLDETAKNYAERIAQAATRMDELIRDLLAYSRITRTDITLKEFELSKIIDEVMQHLQQVIKENHAVIHKPITNPTLVSHHATLFQILLNLVSNAIKFTRPGVTPEVTITCEVEGKTAHISVQDNGIGINPQYHERIFRVFERLHNINEYSGTGIGLAIVAKGVERLGGQFGVKSEERAGASFWFKIPLVGRIEDDHIA